MVKHTPGPWHVEENRAYHTSFLIYSQAGNQLAQCFNWQNKSFDIAADANARLIAAAPELLEALEWVLNSYEHEYQTKLPAFIAARAAIAKATGECK
jgi:hypothetical protein